MAAKGDIPDFNNIKHKYHFPTEPIPRMRFDDPKVIQLIESKVSRGEIYIYICIIYDYNILSK